MCGADVGSQEAMQASGLGHLCAHRRVVPNLLPSNHTGQTSRPDAWMVTCGDKDGLAWARTRGRWQNPFERRNGTWVTLIEFKMCPDTDPTHQQSKADEQHRQLAELIRTRMRGQGAENKVLRTTLLVGHSGTIYRDTIEGLVGLGVTRPAAALALGKAHRIACQHLHSIVGVRRHLEHAATGKGHRQPPRRAPP